MSITLVQAQERDLSGILEILNYEIIHTTALYEYQKKSLEQQLIWFKKKQLEGFPVLVIKEDNKILGFGTYGAFRPRPAYQYTVEHSVYVHHEYQGQGIGNMLLQELINQGKSQGYHSMMAVIDSSNKLSISFHEKFGFQKVGELKEVGYKFNSWLDLTLMQLLLED